MNQSGKELSVLYKISQTISSRQHNISGLLSEVLQIMETDMGVSRGTLNLRKPGTDILNIEASSGLSNSEARRGQYELGEGVTGIVAQTGQPQLIPDINASPDFLNRTKARGDQKTAFLCVPIIHHKEVIGTMSIDLPSREEEELEGYFLFLQHVAQILASAVSTIREENEERTALESENEMLRRQLGDRYSIDNMVGNCNSMRMVYEQIVQVANSAATVLVRGESGTGKELVARAIHFNSPRKNNVLVSVNCAALPENLIESELFGHEKGAFTGAQQQRKGRFELANGGTIFLDEIGDISPAVQVRLLRVLQEKTFERVGGNETISVNVRVVAATSRDLETGMIEQTFREDLYYRLNVFPILLPPLRERKSDIMLLADHFLQKYDGMYGKNMKRISTSAINMMMAYHWPGNVRELENCLERAVLTSSDGVIHGFNLPPSLQTSDETHTNLLPENGANLKQMVEAYEREILIDALKKHRGNAAGVARYLETTQRIINYRIKNLGIEPKNYK
ncbi:sigma 54-interacting transcriptional regulator [Pontiella sulfatireligans]|uniref:Nitrogen fixation protein VnfA n=1 Tax=Pontiella sulfatireligans TaxID=2750658 RepID=A0A6C2ULT7_9BACT|nr:sigma 54-interacting transcriptional regulator [Pontiella sulfatireligans]VGO21225.1 Nitrogen fixation protein VnfA [Pontiella sulfatireligans]